MPILKLKKFLKFYGSHPENFTEDVKEWISSTPADKLRRELQNYRAAVGVDFYNLDLGGALQPAKEGGYYVTDKDPAAQAGLQAMRKFYLKYIGGPTRLINKDGTEEQLSISMEAGQLIHIMIYAPQPIYRAIVDKAISGEEMTDDEIKHINQAISGGEVYQQYSKEKERFILKRRVYFGPFGIIKALYEFIYDIANQRVEIGRCAAKDCNKLFVPTPRGREQLYCRRACQVRAYRHRKKTAV